ncbi:MAG: metallophosphoesterase [Deltaproteobacteria bacterium]|nr:metallophosphoesterase [Deltaproteobacteria bacterium]
MTSPQLWAISDLHLAYEQNRRLFETLRARPNDWLILAGDIAEKLADLERSFVAATERFARVIWVPGNHELWSMDDAPELRGQAKYDAVVALARKHGVLTPEDPFPRFATSSGARVIAPLFLLYDYSFRPPEVPDDGAIEWAREAGLMCSDEYRLHSDPHATKTAWCHARVEDAERRLSAISEPTVIINHFPLRYDLVFLPAIPRFSIWCGTRLTESWHTRFRAEVVVSGHLHMRGTRHIDGVRFEEVSLGYPRQWRGEDINVYLRRIL